MDLENPSERPKKSFAGRIPNPNLDPTKSSVAGVEHDGGVRFDHLYEEKIDSHIPKKAYVYRDHLGRLYFLVDRFGADQMFVTRILKGIMPVSDIVYNNGEFLSYEMPPVPPAWGAERMNRQERVMAYHLVLSFIFNDTDHHGLKGNNMNVSGNDVVMFDFHMSRYFWSNDFGGFTKTLPDEYGLTNKQVRILCTGFLLALHKMFDGEDGLVHMRAILYNIMKVSSETPIIIQDAPGSTIEQKTESFRDEVLRRVSELENIINDYEKV